MSASSLTPLCVLVVVQVGASSLQQRLEAAFFSQQPHLHRCAELVLQATLRNATALCLAQCVPPVEDEMGTSLLTASASSGSDPSATADVLATAEEKLGRLVRALCQSTYKSRIGEALTLLAQPAADPAVVDMAARLTLRHALEDSIGRYGRYRASR